MGAYGVLLILVLVVVSGIIAYLGDVIGRRMGRKRLTLFGLRPRYTAIVVSVFAGMLIAGWTLGAAMLVNENVRLAFTKVDWLRQQNWRLGQQAHRLQGQIESADRQLSERTSQLQARTRELAATRQKSGQLVAQVAAQRQTLAQLGSNLADKKRRLAETSKELASGEAAAKRVWTVIRRADMQRQVLEENVRDLLTWQQRALRTFSEVRTAPVTFLANEEIATAVFEQGLTRPQITRRLNMLVSAANTLAIQRGAKPSGEGRALVIMKNVLDEKSSRLVPYNEQAVLAAVADSIADAPGGIVVRLLSLGNAFKGEQVVADFDQLFNNRKIYDQGQVVAETTLDASLSPGRLFEELVYLLRDRVGTRARRDGMMPTARRLGPDGRLLPQREQGVGEVSEEALFDLVGKIKQLGGQVRVVAVAAQEAWTAGPLLLSLEASKS